MPVKIFKTYWGCRFKCGQKHSINRDWIATHEKICFVNPDTKSCRICEHSNFTFETVYDPNHGGNPGSTDYNEQRWYCEKDQKPYPTTNCQFWKKDST